MTIIEVTSLLVLVLSKESLTGSSLAVRGRDGEDSYSKKILDVKISFNVRTFATSKSSFTFKGLMIPWNFRGIKFCDLAIKGLTSRVSLRRLIKNAKPSCRNSFYKLVFLQNVCKLGKSIAVYEF